MRLLYCRTCSSLEEVPDLDHELGEGEVDPLVEYLVQKHTERDPMGHGDVSMQTSPFRLPVVDDEEWKNNRAQVIKVINESNKSVGMDGWVYEATSTYAVDAGKCYNAHNRPKEGCIDWWDDSKRIGRPTAMGKSALKEGYKLGQNDPHLCQWCPVFTYVQTQVNFKAGMYKDK
jgi:hypothetical protein